MKQYNDFYKAIHKEGYIFIIVFAAVTFLLASFSSTLWWIGFFTTIGCAYFFRNPDRLTPQGDSIIVSPADGIVQSIKKVITPVELLDLGAKETIKVSIFLTIFDVHVNRIPANGKVLSLHYIPGKFVNASLDKASLDNERQSVCIETKIGIKIGVVQIAGLVARRISCDLEKGAEVKVGERYGIIRFGSRLDIYLPLEIASILVTEGSTCVGGETIIADLKQDKEKLEFKRN